MFSRKANQDSHVKHVHTDERNFKCAICKLKVKTKGILRVHMKLHSTNPDDLMTCHVCQRQFKTKNQLTNHMVSFYNFTDLILNYPFKIHRFVTHLKKNTNVQFAQRNIKDQRSS